MQADDPLDALRRLAPVRDLPEAERVRLGVIREGLGRPRRIQPAPERDDYNVKLAELRAEATAADPVVAATTDPQQSAAILDLALYQMATEVAAIGWERLQAEKRGGDVAALASRKVSGLVQLSSLIVERHRHASPELDVRGSAMRRVVSDFMNLLREAARGSLQPEEAETFLAAYEAKLTGWEDKFDPPASTGL